MSMTLAAVYAPIGFTSGLTGALFREFAFTLAAAVIVSGVIALTLSPMMCSKLFKQHEQAGRFGLLVERVFGAIRGFYERRLNGAMRQRPVFALMLVFIIALSGILYLALKRELAPPEDQGVLFAFVNAPEHTNLDYLETYTGRATQILIDVPERQNVFTINGLGSAHTAFVGLILKPWSQRQRTDQMIIGELQPKFGGISGVKTFATSPPAIPIGAGEMPVEFVIKYPGDYNRVAEVLDKIDAAAKTSGLFIFTNTDLRFETPQAELIIDKNKANQLGVKMSDVGTTLATLLGGNYVNRFTIQGRSYQVIPQVPRHYRESAKELLTYQVRTTSGDMVPLSSFIRLDQSVQPNSLATFQQLNSATFQAVPFPGRTVGEGVAFLEQKAKEFFPQGMTYDFQGESRQFVTEGNTLAITFGFSLIIIYLVLAAQFESFRDPFIILIGLPASICGALFFLFVLGEINGILHNSTPINLGSGTINIYTQIGLVTLIGLISKHGILMVDFANKLQEGQGLSKLEAIKHAAAVRLRPILMTTAAMVIGVVPLLIAAGAGAKSRFDIGLVIAAGMTIGTMFTLFITPIVYTYVARDRRGMRGTVGVVSVPPEDVAEAAPNAWKEGARPRKPRERSQLPEAAE
jgi:multidrug efflux pump